MVSQILSSLELSEDTDILFWSWSGKCFSTKDCYMALSNDSLSGPYFWSFWKLKLPPKILFFIWKVVNNVLPTKDLLARRIQSMGLSPICNWCSIGVESQTHLFLDCEIAKWCWKEVCCIWSIGRIQFIALHFQIRDLFNIISDSDLRDAWQVVVVAVIWTICVKNNVT